MPFAYTEKLFHITERRESEISLGEIAIFPSQISRTILK